MDTLLKVAFAFLMFYIAIRMMVKGQRYHKARQRVDERNLNEYGTPVKSLYTNTKIFSLHHRITITDENEQPVYLAHSKLLSLHDITWVETAAGEKVAYIWSKVFSLHERHYVEMASGTNFQLSNELFHLVKDVTNTEELG